MKTESNPTEARITRPPELLLEFHKRMLAKYVDIDRLQIYHRERINHLRGLHETANPTNPPTEPLEDYSVGVAEFALALIGKGINGNLLHLSD